MNSRSLLLHLQMSKKKWNRRHELTTLKKNSVLESLAQVLKKNQQQILLANQKDLLEFRKNPKATKALMDRLELTPARLQGMIQVLHVIRDQEDPVGKIISEKTLPNGLTMRQIQDSLGLILFIFEARPNVITEAFALAFKSGNILIAKNGKEAANTSKVIYQLILASLKKNNLSADYFLGFAQMSRQQSHWLMKQDRWIDLLIPRGGDQLIEFVKENSRIPVIQNDRGLCHVYVDQDADLQMALKILINAKVQRPGVCNSMETLLVHKKIAKEFLSQAIPRTTDLGLICHVCPVSWRWFSKFKNVFKISKNSYDTEYLDLEMNVRMVESLEDAIEHISNHGSHHSECIVTENANAAKTFQTQIDAAVVYWNASTRFTDGYEFGLGGEMGISTQKLHVRGPVGLSQLTSARWLVKGNGTTR